MIDINLEKSLKKINFTERYLVLCEKYFDRENCIKEKSLIQIEKFLNSINIKYAFSKKECFFKIKENFKPITFQFNIIPYNGALQFVWDIKLNNRRLDLSWGIWESILEEMVKKNFEKRPRPYYFDYTELEEILKEAFSIYGDFKDEVLKVDWDTE